MKLKAKEVRRRGFWTCDIFLRHVRQRTKLSQTAPEEEVACSRISFAWNGGFCHAKPDSVHHIHFSLREKCLTVETQQQWWLPHFSKRGYCYCRGIQHEDRCIQQVWTRYHIHFQSLIHHPPHSWPIYLDHSRL